MDRKESGKEAGVVRWSNTLSILILAQIPFGSLTLFMLAPILLPVGHLLLAGCHLDKFCAAGSPFLSSSPLRPRSTMLSSDDWSSASLASMSSSGRPLRSVLR
ncbi:MAG: hypothetical protein IPG58_07130 [Acidobacteria bacterium]|nr:hypothetical protein [Acidobacteriota bacterium]